MAPPPTPASEMTELFLEFVKTYDNDDDECMDTLYEEFKTGFREVRRYCPEHIQLKNINPRSNLMKRVFIALVARGHHFFCWFLYKDIDMRCQDEEPIFSTKQWYINYQDSLKEIRAPTSEAQRMRFAFDSNSDCSDIDDLDSDHDSEASFDPIVEQQLGDEVAAHLLYTDIAGHYPQYDSDDSDCESVFDSNGEENFGHGPAAELLKEYISGVAADNNRQENMALDEGDRRCSLPTTDDENLIDRRNNLIRKFDIFDENVERYRTEAEGFSQLGKSSRQLERLHARLQKQERVLKRVRRQLQIDIFVNEIQNLSMGRDELNKARILKKSLTKKYRQLIDIELPRAARDERITQHKWPSACDCQFSETLWYHINDFSMVILKTPEIRHCPRPELMTIEQLQACIDIGNKILTGSIDFHKLWRDTMTKIDRLEVRVINAMYAKNHRRKPAGAERFELVEISPANDVRSAMYQVQRITEAATAAVASPAIKRGRADGKDSDPDQKPKKSKTSKDRPRPVTANPSSSAGPSASRAIVPDPELASRIEHSGLSAFQKSVLTALLYIPKGGWTTYLALARHLNSSPRAVGNALRNNPFAPEVPCHRVVAADRKIGGFKGDVARNGVKGKFEGEKVGLLQMEGVEFDDQGKLLGQIWCAW